MPRQNRVTPFSTLIATSARGAFTGNRGRWAVAIPAGRWTNARTSVEYLRIAPETNRRCSFYNLLGGVAMQLECICEMELVCREESLYAD
jgi:hypothetical protein